MASALSEIRVYEKPHNSHATWWVNFFSFPQSYYVKHVSYVKQRTQRLALDSQYSFGYSRCNRCWSHDECSAERNLDSTVWNMVQNWQKSLHLAQWPTLCLVLTLPKWLWVLREAQQSPGTDLQGTVYPKLQWDTTAASMYKEFPVFCWNWKAKIILHTFLRTQLSENQLKWNIFSQL